MSRVRRLLLAGAAALLAANVGACTGFSEQSMLVAPGKFQLLNCQDIATNIRGKRDRMAQLERLMEKASESAAGGVIGTVAYRTEYLQVRGELEDLVRTSDSKQCVTQSPWTSQRAVF